MQPDRSRKTTKKTKQNGSFPRALLEIEVWVDEVQRRNLTPAEAQSLAASFCWLRDWRFRNDLAVLIPTHRQLSDDERQRLRRLAEEHDFLMSETIAGVILWEGSWTRQEFKALLDNELRRRIRTILPGTMPELVWAPGMNLWARLVQKARRGNRYAAWRLASLLTQSLEVPQVPGPLEDWGLNDMVRTIARVNLHLERAQPSGDKPNKAAMDPLRLLYLKRLAKGGLRGFSKRLDEKEFLPVLYFALGIRKRRPRE
jgi:hypothetical protein